MTAFDLPQLSPRDPGLHGAFEQHGAVLLRGESLDLDAFESLTREFSSRFHAVGTRQALTQAAGDGHTTEVFRNNFILLGHSEGMYRPYPPPPDACFFMCVTPPASRGGETTLIHGASMLASIPGKLRGRLEDEGIIYECQWEAARWRVEFGVETVAALKTLLDAMDCVRYELSQDVLHLRYRAPAITIGRDGRPAFANGILAHLPAIPGNRYVGLPVYAKASNRVCFGNGAALSQADVTDLIDAHDQNLHPHRWQRGDILIIDNSRFMHGRTMTESDCERVLLSRFCLLPSQ